MPVIAAVFLAPRSFLARFFRSFICFRDFCTASASPFCAVQMRQVKKLETNQEGALCTGPISLQVIFASGGKQAGPCSRHQDGCATS